VLLSIADEIRSMGFRQGDTWIKVRLLHKAYQILKKISLRYRLEAQKEFLERSGITLGTLRNYTRIYDIFGEDIHSHCSVNEHQVVAALGKEKALALLEEKWQKRCGIARLKQETVPVNPPIVSTPSIVTISVTLTVAQAQEVIKEAMDLPGFLNILGKTLAR